MKDQKCRNLAISLFTLALSLMMAPTVQGAEENSQDNNSSDPKVIYVSQDGAGDGLTADAPAAFTADLVSQQASPVELVLTEDINIESTVKITNGQNVTIVDNGTPITVTAISSGNTHSMFNVEEGGILSFRTSVPGEDSLLVFDASRENSRSSTLFVDVTGTFILDGGTLQNGLVYYGSSGAVTIDDNGYFEMNGGIITNVSISNQYCGTVFLDGSGRFEMNGGTISNCTDLQSIPLNTAAVFLRPASASLETSFIMRDGTISDNHFAHGGVFAGSYGRGTTGAEAVFTMEGGTITRNTGTYAGGGVAVFGPGNFYMKGGEISENSSPAGGGVATLDLYTSYGTGYDIDEWNTTLHCPGRFEMTGGTIKGNQAIGNTGVGGGVYIASNTCVIKNGIISDNTATYQGGGIYVATTPYVLQMADTVVTNNTATILGGGMWFCPTGDITTTVTNGGAIFGNTASDPAGADAAGDDVAAVPQTGKTHKITLSDRMLGGGEVCWYDDGGVESEKIEAGNALGRPDGSDRFDPSQPGEQRTQIKDYTDALALKAIVTDEAAELALSQAKVLITGNEAPRGGGIGSNGGIVMGVPGDEWTLNVTKAWDGVEEADRTAVTVRLKIGNYLLDPVTLDETNNWTASFENLPNPDSLGGLSITVIEEGEEYEVSYSEIQSDDGTKTLSVIVTNKPIPDEPDEPDKPNEPDKPDEPDEPDEPDKPDEPDEPGKPDEPDKPDEPGQPEEPQTPEKPSQPDQPKDTVSPETGDSRISDVWPFFLFADVSAVAGITAILLKRRRNQ